jgi:hypothetical protein
LRFWKNVFNNHATAYTIVKCYKWLRVINRQVLYNARWKFYKFNKIKAGLTSSEFQYLPTRSNGVNMFVQHHATLLDATLLTSFQHWVLGNLGFN